MKNAIIFHGTDCKPDDYWYSWLKDGLEKSGYDVALPYYPKINHEPIKTFLPKVLKDNSINTETVMIGHSAGGPLILSILEAVQTRIEKAILVAGYSKSHNNEEPDPILQDDYNWDKIRKSSKSFVFINSVEDPWGCDSEQGKILFDNLGGTQIIRNEGHFGSTSYDQPYPTFPLLKALVLENES